jgi:hypothetical protein
LKKLRIYIVNQNQINKNQLKRKDFIKEFFFSFFYFSEQTNHFADSIVTYFDTALSTMLLYAVERAQYKQVKMPSKEK